MARALGETADEFRARVGDAALIEELAVVLWSDVLKPQARSAAGRPAGAHALSPEARQIWLRLVRDAPGVRSACVRAVAQEGQAHDAFQVQRDHIGEAFKALCGPELREAFLRPLLSAMGLDHDYLDAVWLAEGCQHVRCKADVMAGDSADGQLFRRSVVEYCGSSNLQVFLQKVIDVIGQLSEARPIPIRRRSSDSIAIDISWLWLSPDSDWSAVGGRFSDCDSRRRSLSMFLCLGFEIARGEPA